MSYTIYNNLVSLIIPVYNTEDYVLKCLSSIATQTYQFIEVIIVDDGSTDSSGMICDNFAVKDHRFSVIHKQNEGVDSARNAGLDRASGKYVCFIDSDDYIYPTYVEKLLSVIIETGCDIAVCGYDAPREDGSDSWAITSFKPKPGKIEPFFFRNNVTSFPFGVLWNKMYSRDVIGNSRFLSCLCQEDWLFNYQVSLKVNFLTYIEERLYFYVIRQESLSRSNLTHLSNCYLQALPYLNRISPKSDSSSRFFALDTIFSSKTARALGKGRMTDLDAYHGVRSLWRSCFPEFLLHPSFSIKRKVSFLMAYIFPRFLDS